MGDKRTDGKPDDSVPEVGLGDPKPVSRANLSCDLRLTAEARISIHAKNTV